MWSVADELSGLTSHLCITLITCTALACIYWNNSRTVKLINRIPGPAALPLIGNVLEAAACQPSGKFPLLNLVPHLNIYFI